MDGRRNRGAHRRLFLVGLIPHRCRHRSPDPPIYCCAQSCIGAHKCPGASAHLLSVQWKFGIRPLGVPCPGYPSSLSWCLPRTAARCLATSISGPSHPICNWHCVHCSLLFSPIPLLLIPPHLSLLVRPRLLFLDHHLFSLHVLITQGDR